MPALAAIILAAGSSSRLGQPKQLLQLNGRSLLSHTVTAAHEAGCHRIIVVIGANAEAMLAELHDQPVEIAHNVDWSRGMGSSIRTGIEHLLNGGEVDRVFVLLCDQPHVSPATLRRLATAQAKSGKPVAAATYRGTVGPPVLVKGPFIAALQTLPDDRGAKSLWLDHPESVIPIDCDEAGVDIDLPSDLLLLRPTL